jgi:eukaryotic-like serine/threonine-protein kinase
VPVYELGRFAEGRPYFTMKLVKGRTLAALLKERFGPAHDLPRFLGIFEQVCQTMAYAHARGVIHRDLKPSNIMVGSFGEVQVMDWGLAKVLPQGGVADEPRLHPEVPAVSVIRTVRSGSDADASVRGSVLGTPAYMAPEQAGGDVDEIDERADVFGLGSILCEILTGWPAYTGPSFDAILRKARRGETKDALQRLDGCRADAELVALAGHCLAAEADERPRDAGELARRMTAYLSGVQDRLRAAELARAAEEARAEEAIETAAASERARAAEEARAEEAQRATVAAEGRARAERRARRTTVGLAASVLIAGAIGAAGLRWVERGRIARVAARSAQVSTALQEATGLRGQAKGAVVGNLVPWTKALAAIQKARELFEPGLDLALRGRVEALLAEITSEKEAAEAAAQAAESDRRLLEKLVDIRSAKTDDHNGSISDLDYARAFQEAGIDVTALPPAEAAARIKARPAPMTTALVAALDDWAAARRSRRWDGPGATRLSEVANVADPDPWRVSLRRALELGDRESRAKALLALTASTEFQKAPAVNLDLLGAALSEAKDLKAAENVLRAGRQRFPDDVWLNYDLARVLEALSRRGEAVRYYSIARALRPETGHELAHALEVNGESIEAIAVFRELVRLRPKDGRHWGCYGSLLKKRGDPSEANTALDQAVAILRGKIQLKNRDESVDRMRLGNALHDQGNLETAVEELRASVRLKPDLPEPRTCLGEALRSQGKLEEAISELQKAIHVKPDYANAHYNLGALLCDDKRDYAGAIAAFNRAVRFQPDFFEARFGLGRALHGQGKLAEAIAEYQKAIRIKPGDAGTYQNLGNVLRDNGKLAEAIATYREAIRINPDDASVHSNLGNALRDQRTLEEASAEYDIAIRIDPRNAPAHDGLGNVLAEQGKLEEAIAEFKIAIQIDPNDANPHNGLGTALKGQGRLELAIAEFREAIRKKPDYALPHRNLGLVLHEQGKLEEEIAEFREAIRLKPDDAIAHNNLGYSLGNQGNLQQAIVELREAIRLKADDALPHSNLGSVLQKQGELDAAIAEYREAIRLKPEYAEAHYDLGITLGQRGKRDEAIAAYREAIRLKPGLSMAHNNWAWSLVRSPKRPPRDYDEGLMHARKAIELAKKGENSYGTLALAEYRSGHWALSLAASNRSMELRKGMYAYDWFFQAMARWQKGDKDEARKWFDKAVGWTKEKEPKNAELLQFWSEAAELLGQPGPNAAGAGSSVAKPAPNKP